MIYKIVVQRDDCEVDELYWNGSLEETINLARKIGISSGADQFRVIECAGRGAEICSEEAPFLSKQRYCGQGAAS